MIRKMFNNNFDLHLAYFHILNWGDKMNEQVYEERTSNPQSLGEVLGFKGIRR